LRDCIRGESNEANEKTVGIATKDSGHDGLRGFR
jgi:hypothetical protein